jgi:hypothetical protein
MTRRHRRRDVATPVAIAVLATLALGPVLIHRGYVLVGDMTFVPDQPWKQAWLGLDGSVPRAVPADAVVSLLGHVVPGDLLQKAVLLGILVLAGVGLARLVAREPSIPAGARFGGAVLYVWNPYVYERLAIGHWGLLIGYAVLPWVLGAALDLRHGGGVPALGRLLLLLAAAAVGSPTGGLAAGLVATVVAADARRLRRTAAVLGAVAVVNLPWLAPALLNDVGTSDGSGVAAFAARSDTAFGAWGSLFTFGGIWKQAATPEERDAVLLTTVALLVVLASFAALGTAALRGRAGAWSPGRLAVLAAIGLLLAGVPATGPGKRWVTDLVDAVPGLGLWRDSQKWLMPFVLVGSLGFALLLDALGRRLARLDLPRTAATIGVGIVPVVLLPSLAWGLSGRFDPVAYPSEWYAVRSVLADQPAGDRRTAVLPWSAYQRLPWNDGRAALDPALRFFPGDVVVSEDLAVGDGVTVVGEDRSAARIGRAVAAGADLGPVLADEGVRYLLVEKSAPSDAEPAMPPGEILHDGPELVLIDLGSRGRTAHATHRGPILAADAVALGVFLVTALGLVVRTVRHRGVGYDSRGSIVRSDVDGVADKR